MYSRSYSTEGENMLIPDGYAGTALPLGVHSEPVEEEAERSAPVSIDTDAERTENVGIFSGFLSKLPFGELSNLLPFRHVGIKHFGTEEILILAVAAFLLFSRDGDTECAIMLILLLFIG